MEVRGFTMEDHDAAVALWEATEHMSAPTREECEGVLARDPDLFLVAEDEGRLVGVVMGTYDGRRGWIFRLAVDRAHRGTGLGRRLVEDLERRYHERGIRHVRVLTLSENSGAQAFWERLGYERFDDIVMYSKDTGPRADC